MPGSRIRIDSFPVRDRGTDVPELKFTYREHAGNYRFRSLKVKHDQALAANPKATLEAFIACLKNEIEDSRLGIAFLQRAKRDALKSRHEDYEEDIAVFDWQMARDRHMLNRDRQLLRQVVFITPERLPEYHPDEVLENERAVFGQRYIDNLLIEPLAWDE